jgi:hypothetical protein
MSEEQSVYGRGCGEEGSDHELSLSEHGLPEESVKRFGRQMVFKSWRR